MDFQITPYQLRRILITSLIAVIVFGIYIVVLNIFPKPSVTAYRTYLDSQRNIPYLQGDYLYTYNGMSFTKTNIFNPKEVNTLATGVKLPGISRAIWAGEEGIFLQFESTSYINSLPYRSLGAQGDEFNEYTRSFLWYLRFNDASLHLVDMSPPKSEHAFFSLRDQTLYYLPDVSSEEGGGFNASIEKFSTVSLKKSTIKSDIGYSLTQVRDMFACKKEFRICININDTPTHSVLITYSDDGKSTTALSIKGVILKTSSASAVVGITNESSGGREDADNPLSMTLHNLDTYKKAKTNAKLYAQSGVVSVDEDGTIYAINSSIHDKKTPTQLLLGGKNIFGMTRVSTTDLRRDDRSLFTNTVVSSVSYGNQHSSLFDDENQSIYLVRTSKSHDERKFTSVDPSLARNEVELCVKKSNLRSEYFEEGRLFRIFITDDAAFDGAIKQVSNCLSSSKINLFDYNFSFVGTSPRSGRITTD